MFIQQWNPVSCEVFCCRINIDMETCLQYIVLCKYSPFYSLIAGLNAQHFYSVATNVFCFRNLEKNVYFLLKIKPITHSCLPQS